MRIVYYFLVPFFLFTSFTKFSNPEKENIDFADWMQNMINSYPENEISLKDICLPRAHDAGMYELNHCLFGNACNTKTQELNMLKMLESGIRMFDIRPVKRNKKFFTFHKTKCKGLGCNGAKLETILKDTKAFLEKHNELVVFEISHFCKTSPFDKDFLSFLEEHLGDRIYKETYADNTSFIHRNLNDILNDKDAKGKIVFLMSSLTKETENKEKGFFRMNFIPISGFYSNQYELNKMKADQQNKLQKYDANSNSLFKLCWTLTMDTKVTLDCYKLNKNKKTLKNLAEKARLDLPITLKNWTLKNIITPDKIPNVISVDYSNEVVTRECIKLSNYSLSRN